MNIIKLHSTLTEHYIHVYKLTIILCAIPLLFAPLANSLFTSFLVFHSCVKRHFPIEKAILYRKVLYAYKVFPFILQ
jgi:hypothetical protein